MFHAQFGKNSFSHTVKLHVIIMAIRLKNRLLLSGAALVVGSGIGSSEPLVSIDVGDIPNSGEPSNVDGMVIPGQFGNWTQISLRGGADLTVTQNGVSFIWNVGGVASLTGGWPNGGVDPLRRDYYTLLKGTAGRYDRPIPWEITGLTPGSIYDLILFGHSESQQTHCSIEGYDPGSGVGSFIPTDGDGDANATEVMADRNGKIKGTFDGIDGQWTTFAGLQMIEVFGDADNDGITDDYELAHTDPPSATGLNPNDDLENDGLTNLQEFENGTDPNDPDSDDDTLGDAEEVAGAGSRPPTDPASADTDRDGLSDLVESNTGTWVGSSDTGTSPVLADTDGDALSDMAETNSGLFLSATSTGTSPLNVDSDGDGVGDWYEIVAAFTDPTLIDEKPVVPYPLPDPDGSTGSTAGPVKVYILSGQSNMVGFGLVSGTQAGALERVVNLENKFPNLVDESGAWISRGDVKYRGVISAFGNGELRPGFGKDGGSIGPELGFGHVMGWYHDEPVLLLKSSIGNRSLSWDCLPPGSEQFEYNGRNYPAYGGYNQWDVGDPEPSPFVWYAGKQFDDYFKHEDDMGVEAWASGLVYPVGSQCVNGGVTYRCNTEHTSDSSTEPGVGGSWESNWGVYSVFNAVDVLDNFAAEYPEWAAQGFEIAGYVWWQGHKDQNQPAADRYEQNMVRFIKEIRSYYENRYPDQTSPNTPFVLSTIAFGGFNLSGAGSVVANGQLAVSGETGNYPEFSGNVKTIDARPYWRDAADSPRNQDFHYNHNAETYMLVGDALGRAMVELQGVVPADGLNITSITQSPGGLWELEISGKPSTVYELHSSVDLNFSLGSILTDLGAGGVGVVGGVDNSQVTTNSSGRAVVTVSLVASTKAFVRAVEVQ